MINMAMFVVQDQRKVGLSEITSYCSLRAGYRTGRRLVYTETFERVSVAYQDETWALLDIENTSIALVLPSQHPPHVAFESPDAERYGDLTSHRDGTASVYVQDPFGKHR
jgi:hypothetical protein